MSSVHHMVLALGLLAAAGARAQVHQPPLPKAAAQEPVELTPAEFQAAIASGRHRLVDVRTPAEYSGGRIAGAVNIDWTAPDYERAFAQLDPRVPVLLYCHSGGRSEQALEHLIARGYRAQHLQGGIGAWRKAGLPVVQ